MKTKKFIGGLVAIIGIGVTLMTPDDCKNEVVLRFAGIALFAVGAFIGKFFEFQKAKRS